MWQPQTFWEGEWTLCVWSKRYGERTAAVEFVTDEC